MRITEQPIEAIFLRWIYSGGKIYIHDIKESECQEILNWLAENNIAYSSWNPIIKKNLKKLSIIAEALRRVYLPTMSIMFFRKRDAAAFKLRWL